MADGNLEDIIKPFLYDVTDKDFFEKVVEFHDPKDHIQKGKDYELDAGSYIIITDGTSINTLLYAGCNSTNAEGVAGVQEVLWGIMVNGKTHLEYSKVRVEHEEGNAIYLDNYSVKDATLILVDTRVTTDQYADIIELAKKVPTGE